MPYQLNATELLQGRLRRYCEKASLRKKNFALRILGFNANRRPFYIHISVSEADADGARGAYQLALRVDGF
jgi:hypothetical protein